MSAFVIIGKPNCGKSLFFNRLTGLTQKVANFPGVTVELKTGHWEGFAVIDFPGIYSLTPHTRDEEIAVEKFHEALRNPEVVAIVCLLDGTRLERSLLLGIQIIADARRAGKALIFAVNMMDEVRECAQTINIKGLEKELGQPVLGISAKTEEGLADLQATFKRVAANPQNYIPTKEFSLAANDAQQYAIRLNRQYGPKTDVLLRRQNRLDRFFLSGIWGGVAFVVLMLMLFQSIFSWAAPLMDGVENLVGMLGEKVAGLITQPIAHDFVQDAIFGGFGSFLVFVPQIFVLTFLIGVLEDSGYLARAAVICHRPLKIFGLSGKSFIPLLSGHACAIPAMFAARTIESPRHRLFTILAIPLMACSARLPVYGLLVAALIPNTTFLGGLFGLRGFTFFALFTLGIVIALCITALLNKWTPEKPETSSPFIIELPPYRLPQFKPLMRRALNHSWAFIQRAGGVIFAVTVIVWILGYFPQGSGHLGESWLAKMGQWFEPLVQPIGLDWRFAVAILSSFVAREVFVGTLGTIFGIEGADDNVQGIIDQLQHSGLTLASGLALLIFYVVALQCASTLAVMRKEVGKNWIPAAVFFGYGALAYALAVVTYYVTRVLV